MLKLKNQYVAFSDSESILGYLLAAYQEINKLKAEEVYESASHLENDAMHFKQAMIA